MASVLLAISVLVAQAACSFMPTGATFQLKDLYFFASPFAEGKAYGGNALSNSQLGFVPVTVVSAQDAQVGSLQELFTNWAAKDDVWQPEFLETVLVAGSHGDKTANESYHDGIASVVLSLSQGCSIPSGPYFLNTATGQVHRAFRLYDDFSNSFYQALLQQPDGQFQTLSAQIPASASVTIGVPSRLYFTPSKEKPLAGVRIGVKDIYSLAGAKRSCGNRAWFGLYPPSNVTCTAIQNLIDAGAVIVGTQKLSQFANGEIPTADWVDYHAPFNPRGDGYQDPATSSAGAGASVASYEWLDLAVGSDTGGSIRGPAGNNGLFGNRPSHGLVTLENVMPLSPTMDTAGFLGRDPRLIDLASAAMYQGNYTTMEKNEVKYPTSLVLIDYPTTNSTEDQMKRKFAKDLGEFLNATTTSIDLEQEWKKTGPSPANEYNITQFLNLTYTALISKQQTKLVREPFYNDYAAAHDGRLPFVDPVSLVRWGWGDSQPDSILEYALKNKTIFMDWFNSQIAPPDADPSTCSSAIVLHTDDTGYLTPRNEYRSPPKPPLGFSNGEISIFAENPDSVFPLGQVASFSSITNHTEYLPVSIDVMAAKGCDGLISRLARDLVDAGLLTVPKVGSGLDGGEILLRRYM